MNYYEHHLGDYAEATAHLSFVEDAAYSRLMRKAYATEGPLPADTKAVQRLVGARSKDEREAVDAVLAEFWTLTSEGWRNTRCDAEIARYQDKQRKAKASAEARWSHTERNANALPNAMRTHCEGNALQSPVSKHQEETSNLPVAPARPLVEPAALALVGKPWEPPDCPHAEVLALWADVLPAMPQHLPSQWKGSRADHLRVRWRETAVAEKWPDKAAGLTYLRRLFGYVGKSPFLTGRSKPGSDKRPFVIELEWLVNPANWAKVLEGKYHVEAA